MTKLLLPALLIVTLIHAQLPPESDPHRGVYFDRFVKKKLTSNAIDPFFSILSVDTNSDGIFEKEDVYLEYVCENHITYIALYDLRQITGGSMTAWNENTKRYENLEDHLCRFMEKAKNQYGVTQIGGVVGSAGAVTDLQIYMDKYPVAPGCTTCQADFDVVTIEYEFWGDCMGDLPNFITIMDAMYSMKQSYNAVHPNNPITTDAYIAFLDYCMASPGLAQTAQVIDGCMNCSPFPGCANPHPQKIDRVLYSVLSTTPLHFSFTEINSFENIQTFDTTDLHPMFYSEGMNSAGTMDFFGPWLASEPLNTIFIAEDYFYYWWRVLANAAYGQPQMNDVQPGGAHWFAASHMVGWLDHPQMLQVTEPYCTTDSAKVTLHYVGPDESGIDYVLSVTRDSDNAVVYPLSANAFTGTSVSTVNIPGYRTINFADTITFPPLYLPQGEYTAHIYLAYDHSTGCTYSSDFKFHVDTRARLQVTGDTAFCHSLHAFLSTNTGASSYTWYRNGLELDGASTNILKVVEGGDYYCVLAGGTCPSVTDTIHITVHPLPEIEVNANCNGNGTITLKTDLQLANSSSTAVSGSGGVTYQWNTGETTDQITVNATAAGPYRVIITDPYSGCSLYRHLSIPNPLVTIYSAVVSVVQQPNGCAHDGKLTASLTPAPGVNDPVRYLWSTGETTATISNLAAGTYSVEITYYNNACSSYGTVTIGTPATLVLNEVVTPSPCNNTAGGSIVLNPVGGPYIYLWANMPDENGYSSTSMNQIALFPGIYELAVTDTNGCTSFHSFTVGNVGGPIKVSAGTVTPVSGCSTNGNGSATVQITGGNGAYSQSWTNSQQTLPDGSILNAGSYKVVVTDNSGCTGYAYVHVPSVNSPLYYELLDSSRTRLECDSMSDGQLFVCLHGGVDPYSVNAPWSINANIAEQINLNAGIYPLQITDSMGCVLNDTLTIDSIGLMLMLSVSHTHCIGCADGSIQFQNSGGTTPYLMSWSPQVGALTDSTIEQLPAGIYSVCVTDSNQCIYCSMVTVLDDPLGFSDLANGKKIRIYPNPTTGSFTIITDIKSTDKMYVEIRQVYGKILSRSILKNSAVDGLQLANGMYYVSVFDEHSRIACEKLIISK